MMDNTDAKGEREAIVKWLREQRESVARGIREKKPGPDSSVWWALGFAADAIENGDHMEATNDRT